MIEKMVHLLAFSDRKFLILVTVLGIVWEDAAQQVDFARKNLPPGTDGLFGTDWMGRDMLKRTVAGLSLSIRLGLLTAAISAAVALALASPDPDFLQSGKGIPGCGSRDCPDALGVAGEAFAGGNLTDPGKSVCADLRKTGEKALVDCLEPHRPAGIAAICDRVNSSLSPCDSS